MADIRSIYYLVHFLGPRWILFRFRYSIEQRLGFAMQRLPITSWDEQPLIHFLKDQALGEPKDYLIYRREKGPPFFFAPKDRPRFAPIFGQWDVNQENPINLARQLREGKILYFEHDLIDVGFPPDWHRNPFSGHRVERDNHWSMIDEFGSGDIKIIWEVGRFGFVYPLVRAYWRTGDETYPEIFWQLIESWCIENPPQQGFHWKCGQEISFRVMAWCFGLYGFFDSPTSTAERVASLARMIALSGHRIEANFSYALSQQNNHGISEGMGLWTIGSLFPEFYSSDKWRRMGCHALEKQGKELIYEDGAFAQHSVNYHRLVLHDYLWVLRLGELHGWSFSNELWKRVRIAGEFLFKIQDELSGRVPYYGQNDGTLILPLNNCDYQDFRPVIQAIRYLTTGTRCYSPGAWDEDLLWLFGRTSLEASCIPQSMTDFQAGYGGYYTLRSSQGFIFTRCAKYRHRPSQADSLHMDLWWKGQNIAEDAGTYSYNAPEPWNNPLARTTYHNTVTVDNADQMDRVGKFLWLPWLRGQVLRYQQSMDKHLAYWEGEHNGYTRLKPSVSHRRGILRLSEDHWLIVDALCSSGKHRYRLHWLLADYSYEWHEETSRLKLETLAGLYYIQISTLTGIGISSLVRADEQSPRGWRAPYYNYREPALSLDLVVDDKKVFFWSLFGPDDFKVRVEGNIIEIQANTWQAFVKSQISNDLPLITYSSLTNRDTIEDELTILL